MMNAMIENMYNTYLGIRNSYKAAEAANNEAGKEAARETYKALQTMLKGMDKEFQTVYRLYEDARDNGRDYIDIHECIFDKDACEIVAAFHQYGVERFTMSSTWSGATEIAWLFTCQHYKITGMEMVVTDGDATDFEGNTHPTLKPAYVFERV